MNGFCNGYGGHHGAALVDVSELQHVQRKAIPARIESYWNALRGPRLLPLRTEIDPRAFKGALDYCFALERAAPGDARVCVVGSHLGQLMGGSVRGMPMSSLLTVGCREMFAEMLEEVFDTPATASLHLSADTGYGRPPLEAWMKLLPVGDAQGDTSRVIGVLVSDTEVGGAPVQFDIEDMVVSPLLAQREDRPWRTRASAAG